MNQNHHNQADSFPLLSIISLSKSYDGHPVLWNFSMDFAPASSYCLMAASGSGKTTLFRLILGLEQPDSGAIHFHSAAPDAKLPRISAVFQEDRLLEGFTALENLRFALGNRYSAKELTDWLLRLLPESSLQKPVREFSGGMKRRTAILRAVLAPAEIVLMDEPFTGLDPATKQTVIGLIRELCTGKLLIASTHAKEDAALLHARIILL